VIYLERYGRGIAAPKVIDLAVVAGAQGCPDMAAVFWAKAYELETGRVADVSTLSVTAKAAVQELPTVKAVEKIASLPAHLQPGSVMTMQPVDTDLPREYFIAHPSYYGQPKRDGSRMVIIVAEGKVYYQSRSTALKPRPSKEIEDALITACGSFGNYILDGELWYRSVSGKEHRTAAQAATQNAVDGQPQAECKAIYTIFKCLYEEGRDLTPLDERERISYGLSIAYHLGIHSNAFEQCPTAISEDEKRALVEKQRSEGREGEVWVHKNCQYVGGKNNNAGIVRTKYLKPYTVWVTGLTDTTADGRLFGAIEVSADREGKQPMGKIGTGFDATDQAFIVKKFRSGPYQIEVEAQGLTEGGKLWLGRYNGEAG
jgi:bifunctional non-homologous end joining protein LigD